MQVRANLLLRGAVVLRKVNAFRIAVEFAVGLTLLARRQVAVVLAKIVTALRVYAIEMAPIAHVLALRQLAAAHALIDARLLIVDRLWTSPAEAASGMAATANAARHVVCSLKV